MKCEDGGGEQPDESIAHAQPVQNVFLFCFWLLSYLRLTDDTAKLDLQYVKPLERDGGVKVLRARLSFAYINNK